MAYKSIKEAVENELGVTIAIKLNRLFEELERKYGHIHLTALDGRAYKRHTNGLIKVLVRAMIRKQLIP